MNKFLITFWALLLASVASAQTARVQIIHNSPSPTVDVYANGVRLLDDFAFRSATSFVDVPADAPISLAVAPASSMSAMEAIATFNTTFESGKTYAVTASGVVNNTATPFTLITDAGARESATASNKVSLNVLHGAPDAPAVDVVVRTGGKIVSNLAYGQFTPYLSVDPAVYYLDVKPAGGSAIVATFKADLSTAAGAAVRVFASGFLAGNPDFGLFAALPDGTVLTLEKTQVARVQVIHNSPDPSVDIYANGAKILDDFKFLSATPFVWLPAGVNIDLGVADENSQSVADTLKNFPVTLTNGGTYVVTASGIVGDPNTPFGLIVNANAREAASDTARVDVSILHGAPTVPNVDLNEIYLGLNLASNLAYGSFTPYLSLVPGKYDIGLRLTGTQNNAAELRADLSSLKGRAAHIFAATLLDGPAPFGVFAALPNGTVIQLGATPRAEVQVVHNSPSPTVDVYLGPTKIIDNFEFRKATPYVSVIADRGLTVSVAPESSASVADAIASFPVNFATGKAYTTFASGIVNGSPAFELLTDEARKTVQTAGAAEFSVLHGAPGAPAVDVTAVGVGDVVTDLAYGEFTPYFPVPPANYTLQVKAAGTNTVVATFQAPLTTLGGKAFRVFASGFLDKSPSFGLFAVLEDGSIIALPRVAGPAANVQIIHNSASPTVDIYANGVLLLNDFKYRTATPFVPVPSGVDIKIDIAPENSSSAADAIASFTTVFAEAGTYVVAAQGIVNDANTPFTLVINKTARQTASNGTKVDVAVLHGSTNAPAVDVDAVFVADNVIENLAYGEFTDYLSLDPGVYDLALRLTGTPDIAASYRADLSTLAGGAATVFASGELGGSPDFGLFVALATGQVIALPETPTARVQVIHNAPNPTVDVFIGNTKAIDNFDFRQATSFLDIPANRDLNLGIAPASSNAVADTIASFKARFEEGKTYAVFASGIVGNTATPFTLLVDEAREAALAAGKVEFATLHGAPDAPAVDVDVVGVGNIISNLKYGEFSPYLAVDPAAYVLRVRVAGTANVVGFYAADLSTLVDGSARVFASGLVAGNPDFGLFAALADGTVIELPRLGSAKLQVIHNSASPTVDIYANSEKILDDFEYRTATPFIDVPSDVNIRIGVAPANSASVADTLVGFSVTFTENKKYVVTASGIVGNTATPFTLIINENGQDVATQSGKVDVAVLHGSTNAPAVDVDAVFVADNVVSNLPYGQFTPYLSLDPTKYDLAVRANGNTAIVASFRADLSGLAGGAATVFASGELGGSPAFGLFAALANGTVIQLPLTPTARLQVIHNSPNPTVDVYAGNTRLLNDFEFRKATPFISVPADRSIRIGVAPGASASVADTLVGFPVNLETGKTYAVFASGIVGSTTTPFTLLADEARESSTVPAEVQFAVHHGAPGAPAVDVAVFGAGNIVTDLAYGDFTPYLGVAPATYLLQVKPAGSSTVVGTFSANLSALAGGAARVFASGIFGGNPAFGLFAALPDGTVVEFPAVAPPAAARMQVIHNSPSPTVDIYVNGEKLLDDFKYRTATPFIDVPAGTPLSIAVAPENSQSVNDAIATFTETLTDGKTYIVTASGIVGNTATPFTLIINDAGREAAAPGKVDIAVLHGATNAPAVDVDEILTGNVLTNLAYGQFTPYLSLDPGIYDLGVFPSSGGSPVGIYRADLSGLSGGAAYVFASGLAGGTPAFGLFAALANGTVIELKATPFASVQVIHNSPSPTVDVYAGNAPIIDDFAYRTATPFVGLPADRNYRVAVALSTSTSVADTLVGFPVRFESGKNYTVIANGIVGNTTTPFTLAVDANARLNAPAGFVAVSAFHGSPGAPSVDIAGRLEGNIFTNVAYNTYTNYVQLPVNQYFIDVKPTGSATIVGTFLANLTAAGGVAMRVFASGILGGSPAFGLFAALPNGQVIQLPSVPVARMQVIHNVPSPTVDVYINGNRFIDDFEFRDATPFVFVPAELPLEIGIAPGNSQSAADVIAKFNETLVNGKTYVAVASGVVGGTPAISLVISDKGQERVKSAGKIELAVMHGIVDAPTVDLNDLFTGDPVIEDLAYGQFRDYLSIDPGPLVLQMNPSSNPNQWVGIWGGDFTPLANLTGVVFASGRLSDDSYDLMLALPDGAVIPLPSFILGQLIHNSPSPAVDIYLGDDTAFEQVPTFDSLLFRTATGYLLYPAREPFRLGVALGTSTGPADILFTKNVPALRLGKFYTIMAAGVVGGNPGFDLFFNENARLFPNNPSNVEFNLFHGSPDAPEVDVVLPGSTVIFDNVQFGEFADYLSVPAATYTISVTPADDNQKALFAYRADVSGLAGRTFTAFASGFVGNQPGFEVWVALPNGVTFPLQQTTGTNDLDRALSDLRIAPNPATDVLNLQFETSESLPLRYGIRDVTGKLMQEGDFGAVQGSFNYRFDVAQLPAGLYNLEIISEKNVKAMKFVKVDNSK